MGVAGAIAGGGLCGLRAGRTAVGARRAVGPGVLVGPGPRVGLVRSGASVARRVARPGTLCGRWLATANCRSTGIATGAALPPRPLAGRRLHCVCDLSGPRGLAEQATSVACLEHAGHVDHPGVARAGTVECADARGLVGNAGGPAVALAAAAVSAAGCGRTDRSDPARLATRAHRHPVDRRAAAACCGRSAKRRAAIVAAREPRSALRSLSTDHRQRAADGGLSVRAPRASGPVAQGFRPPPGSAGQLDPAIGRIPRIADTARATAHRAGHVDGGL